MGKMEIWFTNKFCYFLQIWAAITQLFLYKACVLFVASESLKMHNSHVTLWARERPDLVMCLKVWFQSVRSSKFLSHFVQLTGFSPVCFKMCFFSSGLLLNFASHIEWLCGLMNRLMTLKFQITQKSFHIRSFWLLLCIFAWLVSASRSTNPMPHFWRLYGFLQCESSRVCFDNPYEKNSCHRQNIHTILN